MIAYVKISWPYVFNRQIGLTLIFKIDSLNELGSFSLASLAEVSSLFL